MNLEKWYKGFGYNDFKIEKAGRLECGGVKEDRTPDLYNAIVALYQLSYDPNSISNFIIKMLSE